MKKTSTTLLEKKNEEQEKLLAGKDKLIKEINHRVKNNYQRILSFLLIQDSLKKIPAVSAELKSAASRVLVFGLIHTVMEQQCAYHEIQCNLLCDALVKKLIQAAGNSAMKCDIRLDSIILDTGRATAVALILNELAVNSLTHGLSRRADAILKVRLKKKKIGLMLSVADNGPGIPKKIDIYNANTAGLLIVNLLVRQLKGTLTGFTGKGTVISVSIP